MQDESSSHEDMPALEAGSGLIQGPRKYSLHTVHVLTTIREPCHNVERLQMTGVQSIVRPSYTGTTSTPRRDPNR